MSTFNNGKVVPYHTLRVFFVLATELLYLKSSWVNKTLTITKCSFLQQPIRPKFCLIFSASVFHQKNFFALIEGSHTKSYACALSAVSGIPLVRLYGNKRPFDQCDKAVQMSAGYRDYAHATLDIVNEFQWKRAVSIYDGKPLDLCKDSPLFVSSC